MGWQDSFTPDPTASQAAPVSGSTWQSSFVSTDQPPPALQSLPGEEGFRQLGLTSRDLLQGAGSMVTGVGDIANTGINVATGLANKYAGTSIPALGMPSDDLANALSAAGLPKPRPGPETTINNAASVVAGLAPGGAQLMNAGKELVGNVGDMFAPAVPATSREAKAIAQLHYNQADDLGGVATPQFTNKIIDKALETAPQTQAGQATVGTSPVADLAQRWQVLRDKPLTLKGMQEIDQGLSSLIDNHVNLDGTLNQEGKNLKDVQNSFRSMMKNPSSGDLVGGTQGIESYQNGVKAWSQAQKMSDIERIGLRAQYSDNPSTIIKNGTKTLLSNPGNTAGWSNDEMDALKAANSRGLLGGTLNTFGSKLIPTIAAAIGLHQGGATSAVVDALMANAGTSVLRKGASSIQQGRLNNALDVLGKNVPSYNPVASNSAPNISSQLFLEKPSIKSPPGGFGQSSKMPMQKGEFEAAARLARLLGNNQ